MHLNLSAARFLLAEKLFPYYASAIWRLIPVEVARLREFVPQAHPSLAIGVDKFWRLYYDPTEMDNVNPMELACILAHEIGHLLREHNRRAEKYGILNAARANVAGDCELNDNLEELPWGNLKAAMCFPSSYKLPNDLLMEEYYERLPVSKMVYVADCGSCASGGKRSYEKAEGDKETPAVSGIEGGLIAKEVAKAVRQAGNTSAGMKRWAEAVLWSQVDWRRELRAFMRSAVAEVMGKADYTYQRPARRQSVYDGFIMPGMRDFIPSVAFIIDTSGSMSNNQMAQGVAEVAGVMQSFGISPTVICADAAVGYAKKVWRTDQIELIGGGGTDMQVGIDYALNLKPRPNVIIVATDGETPWPSAPVAVPIVAILIGTNPPAPPDWIRSVRVKPSLEET